MIFENFSNEIVTKLVMGRRDCGKEHHYQDEGQIKEASKSTSDLTLLVLTKFSQKVKEEGSAFRLC